MVDFYKMNFMKGVVIFVKVDEMYKILKGTIIPDLQNRVIHYDVANRVTNSKSLFFKKIFFELLTRDFQTK